MKVLSFPKACCALLICISLLSACKKEVDSNSNAVNSSLNNDDLATATTLILQPGRADGHDAVVNFLTSNPSLADSNYNRFPELDAYSWTNNGYLTNGRFFIKFSGLSAIPTTAKIVSATLYLHGVPTSSMILQGNSIYPGSPYNIYPDNSCLVQRVIEKWNSKTITWNTQPDATFEDQGTIPISTKQWNYNAHADVTKMVQTMVAIPSKNNGFRVSLNIEQNYRSMLFSSCEVSDSTKRPKLIVKYR